LENTAKGVFIVSIQALEQQAELQKKFGEEALNKLKDPMLISHVWQELDKKHKLDHKEKLAVFLVCCSSYLKNPSDHVSCALKGDSSSGKDNCIKNALSFFSEHDSFLLTRGTQSALEEEANNVNIIAFSEINKHRENGANSDLTEVFKQLAEGGTLVLKRDKKTHEVIKIRSEQKTLLYGTTESQSDEELETRYIVIPIKSDIHKNKIVINNYLESITNSITLTHNSWLKQATENLKQYDVIIPYAPHLESLFDCTKERIKRDVKRLMAITKAVTWLYQLQRTETPEGFLVSKPQDFVIAYEITKHFFALSYSGMDHRVMRVYDEIVNLEGKHAKQIIEFGYGVEYSDWVIRHLLMENLAINSLTTIKNYEKSLIDLDLVEGYYDPYKPRGRLLKSTKRGYQLGYQEGVRGISVTPYDTLLAPYFDTLKNKCFINKNEFDSFLAQFRMFFDKLTPSKLTPSKEAGYMHIIKSLSNDFGETPIPHETLNHLGITKDEIDYLLQNGTLTQTKPQLYTIRGVL